jgi:O-antigen/teichoic acid export membrane protein
MSDFFRKSFGTLIAQTISTITALVLSIAIARGLGPEGRGGYALLTLIIAMTASFGTLGIGTANVYFVGRKRPINEVVSNSLLLSAILGGIVIAASFFFLGTISSFVGGIATQWFILALFGTIPLRLASFYLIEVVLGLNKIATYNVYNILANVLNLAFVGLIWLVTGNVLSAALLAYLLTPFCLLIFALAQVWRVAPLKLRLNFGLMKESVSFGIKGHIGTVCGFLSYRVDMFLVGALLGTQAVGYYAVAVGLAEQIWRVPDAASTVLFPKVASSEEGSSNRATALVCRHTLFISLLLAVGLLVVGGPLVTLLYGQAFRSSVIPMFLLLPGVVAMGMEKVLSSHITGSGRPIVTTYAAVASLLINIGVNLVLVPRWGISGAAIASTISYSLGAAVLLLYFLRKSKYHVGDALLIRMADIKLYPAELKKALAAVPLNRGRCNR